MLICFVVASRFLGIMLLPPVGMLGLEFNKASKHCPCVICGYFPDSSLWKRVIAWERSRAASAYGIIWGEASQNKHGGI